VPTQPNALELYFGADGSLYVSDSLNNNVQRYDGQTGDFLGTFIAPERGGLNTPSYMLNLPAQDEASVAATANNVPPAGGIHRAGNSTPTQINLTSTVTDVGTLDTVASYAWSVTNGTPIGPTNTASFSFVPGTGTITVALTVTDEDTGASTAKTQIIVGTTG